MDLEIPSRRPPIQIEGANRAIKPINGDRFGVQGAALQLKNLDATTQKAAVHVAGGTAHDGHVADAGGEDLNFHTPLGRGKQSAGQARGGQKIGCGQKDSAAGAAQGVCGMLGVKEHLALKPCISPNRRFLQYRKTVLGNLVPA